MMVDNLALTTLRIGLMTNMVMDHKYPSIYGFMKERYLKYMKYKSEVINTVFLNQSSMSIV